MSSYAKKFPTVRKGPHSALVSRSCDFPCSVDRALIKNVEIKRLLTNMATRGRKKLTVSKYLQENNVLTILKHQTPRRRCQISPGRILNE